MHVICGLKTRIGMFMAIAAGFWFWGSAVLHMIPLTVAPWGAEAFVYGRRFISMGVSVLVYAVFIKSVRKTIFKDKMLGGLFCFIILYFSFYYVVGLYHTGVNRIILGCAVVFVGMSVPALVSGLYAGQNRIEKFIFLATEYSSFIFVPFVVAYICAFFEVYNFNNLYKVDTLFLGHTRI